MTFFLTRLVVRVLPRWLLDPIDWWLAGPPPVAPARASQPVALQILIACHRDEIIDRLTRIHAAPDPHDVQNRFLVLSLADRPGAYVQCAFGVSDRWMLCEIASGAYFDVPRTMFLPAAKIAAIGRLGFTTDDREENFRRTFRVPDPPDLAAIATLLLTALYVAFDARAEQGLEFTAPYASDAEF